MKRKAIVTILITGLLVSGCLVGSLHPFYKIKDKIYDPSITGTYIDEDSCIWDIEQNLGNRNNFDSTYTVTYYENDTAISNLVATMFALNDQIYVDFFPNPDKYIFSTDLTEYHYVPLHTLARFHKDRDTLMLFWYGEEWLNDLFETNRIRIKHEKVEFTTYRSNILTAETDDLQKFILKYMNDEKVLKEIEDAFTLGEGSDDHIFIKLYPFNGSQ